MEQEFPAGSRVKHRRDGKEGTVASIQPPARRRIEWDDDRITLTHIGDLLEVAEAA